jgi:lipopolysaccharide/colanic/teichoic acid biosynthesis glycosyltransferase
MLSVNPGMTGLWQVEGRSRVPFNEMVRMDLRYIRHCSLGLDLRILAKTVPVVLSCDGAD